MTTTSSRRSEPRQGEVWTLAFDPTVGSEVGKTRPAVVVSCDGFGRLPLKVVVPLSTMRERHLGQPWLIPVAATRTNGLHHDSVADVFQIKSVSLERFGECLGEVEDHNLWAVMDGVLVCLGFSS